MKEIKYTIIYCLSVRNFVIPFSYGSGDGSTRQKVTVPTAVPVPQQCLEEDLAGDLQGALLGE